jgi:hypothetical protein
MYGNLESRFGTGWLHLNWITCLYMYLELNQGDFEKLPYGG